MQRLGSNRFIKGVLFCFLITGVFLVPNAVWGGQYGVQAIKQRINALIHLHAKMAERINTARSIRADLMARDREFSHEIRATREQLNATTYSDAITDHRIRNNLKLVQLVTGYCSALDDKIAKYQVGLVKLKYLINRAEDELKMYKALESFDTTELLTDIEQVITEYQAEINLDLIESDKIAIRSCESIWEDIVAGRL